MQFLVDLPLVKTVLATDMPTTGEISHAPIDEHGSSSSSTLSSKQLKAETTISWDQSTKSKSSAGDKDDRNGKHVQHRVHEDISENLHTSTAPGLNSHTVSLIIQDGSGTPVTVLSQVSTLTSRNFISSAIVDQLNLTNRIILLSNSKAGLLQDSPNPIQNQPNTVLGTLTLNHVIVGRHDRPISDVTFVVFADNEHHKNRLSDVIVGSDFLNKADALRLSSDFLGVGAKKGLDVVVRSAHDGSAVRLDGGGLLAARGAIMGHGEL